MAGRRMVMLHIIGRVTKDLEPQTSPKGKLFVSFDVAENQGYGENAETQFHRCTIWGEDDVNRIVNAKVQKGSLLEISGRQKLDPYINKKGEAAVNSNVTVSDWQYVPIGAKKSDDSVSTDNAVAAGYNDLPTEDCDDGLPA